MRKTARTGLVRSFVIALCMAIAMTTAVLLPSTSQKTSAATEQSKGSTAILFQGFHWHSANYNFGWYDDIKNKATDLQGLGVTHVWFPPPSDAASNEGYLPRQLNLLDSKYGAEYQLRDAISALSAKGIKSVADIVINHRVGTRDWADFTNPTWQSNAVARNDEWPGATGNFDSGDPYGAARDIDHSQLYVRDSIKQWMNQKLKGVGFTGIRYDYSKGYAASYAKEYHDAFTPDFCVGEIWTDLDYNNVNAHRQLLVNWVDGTQGTCGAFDFTTKGLLNKALTDNEYWRLRASDGKPAGGIGWWAQKMVTFVDNHDTGPSESCNVGQRHWPVPCNKVMEGYAYILTHPGIPTIYYPHVYNWGMRAQIKALVDVRKAAGITSTSSVQISRAENGLYAAIIDSKVAMKIGPNTWNPGSGWTLAASGTNYAVWTMASGGGGGGGGGTCTTVPVTFTISNANTTFGQSLYVVGNQAALGNWNPASGFKLTIQGSGANATWSGTVNLPAGASIQYKFVKYDGSTAVWESNFSTASGNREGTVAACNSSSSFNGGVFKF